jgi:hypothetical protein
VVFGVGIIFDSLLNLKYINIMFIEFSELSK